MKRKIAIWGAGELGLFCAKQMEFFFNKIVEIKTIVDSNKDLSDKLLNGYMVKYPREDILNKNELDYVLVCSKRYDEIKNIIINDFQIQRDKIIRVVSSWPEGLDLEPRLKWEKLTFLFENASDELWFNEIQDSYGLLNKIGMKYKTDKAICMQVDGGFRLTHDYLRLYERFLPAPHHAVSLCELGCGTGASLKMWKDYYKHGRIVGVDINESAKNYEEDRVDVVIGNAASGETKEKLKNYGTFHVIIDDASHAWGDMRMAFEMLWDVLKEDGIYIVEDINCGAYGSFPEYPPVYEDALPIIEYFKYRANILCAPKDWNPEYNRNQFYMLPKKIRDIEKEIDSICFIHGSIIIKKV